MRESNGAEGGTRTPTPLRALDPETAQRFNAGLSASHVVSYGRTDSRVQSGDPASAVLLPSQTQDDRGRCLTDTRTDTSDDLVDGAQGASSPPKQNPTDRTGTADRGAAQVVVPPAPTPSGGSLCDAGHASLAQYGTAGCHRRHGSGVRSGFQMATSDHQPSLVGTGRYSVEPPHQSGICKVCGDVSAVAAKVVATEAHRLLFGAIGPAEGVVTGPAASSRIAAPCRRPIQAAIRLHDVSDCPTRSLFQRLLSRHHVGLATGCLPGTRRSMSRTRRPLWTRDRGSDEGHRAASSPSDPRGRASFVS